MQETHILASLEHPFIVRYYDSFVELRRLVLVMEYAENGSLHTVLQRHQKLGGRSARACSGGTRSSCSSGSTRSTGGASSTETSSRTTSSSARATR